MSAVDDISRLRHITDACREAFSFIEGCDRCGEEVFSRETTDQVRVMLHRQEKPIKSIPLEVFSYGEAV